MSTSSDSSQITEQQPSTQHFTLVVNEDDYLSIGIQRLNADSFTSLTWSYNKEVILTSNNEEDSDDSNKKEETHTSGRDDNGDRYKVEHDLTADNHKLLKSTTLMVQKVEKGDTGLYECHIKLGERTLKRQINITQDVLERLTSNKGSVLNKKIKEKHRNADEKVPIQKMSLLCLPILIQPDSDEEDDDVVMDLPRIPSRIFSRAGSVEDDDLRTGLTSPLLQVQKQGKRFRRDSDSSEQDENDDPGIIMPQRRSRRMSSIDISKSAQQRLIKMTTGSPTIMKPQGEESSILNPDMEMMKQKLFSKQKSRRISLAEIIPDWPRLEKPILSSENNHSIGSSFNKFGLPDIKLDLSGLEMQQVERRKSFSVRSRRTSLAEVIPDWPQLQKPKDKRENFVDELEDVTASEKDARMELSCRFSKPNCQIYWFKDHSEIFAGQKYNFLQDANGVIRLIIQRLGVQDSGVYMCQVNDKHETKANLTVEEKRLKFTFIKKMPLNLKAKEKKKLLLECVLNDSRGIAKWTRNDEVIEYTPGLYEISRRDHRCMLSIPDLSMDLDGSKFECSVFGDQSTCHLTVEDPEYELLKRITDQDAFEKETAIFECEVNYEDAPVKWFKNAKEIEKDDERYHKKAKGTMRRLIIKKVEAGDQAVYRCEVQNKGSSARLFVSPDLIILEHLSCQSVLEHELIELKTKVNNPKNHPVQWFKNDTPIDQSDDRRWKIENLSNKEHYLRIRNACLEDAGSYSCKWLSRTTQADVVVRECRLAPSVDQDQIPKEIMVKSGKRIKISIPYVGTPNPVARWRKDEMCIESDDHTILQQYDSKCVLTIESSERKDEGIYVMNLGNDCGEISVEMKIRVLGPPSKPEAPIEVMNIFNNKCHLSWNKPKDDGGVNIDKYVVEVYDITEGELVRHKNVKNDTQCSVGGLVEGHSYRFKVKACNAEGDSDWLCLTEDVVAKDPWEPPGRPGKPKMKSCEQDMVEIEWKACENDGGAPVLKYVLEKRNISDAEWQTVGMVPPTDLCAVISDMREAQEYVFRVVAVNKAGRGEWSEKSDKIQKMMKKGAEADFGVPLENTYTKEGCEVRMKTKIISDPWPQIKWYINDQLVTENEDFQMYQDSDSGELELVIRRAEPSDAGVIVCEVTNSFGSVTSYAQLRFLVKPSFKQKEVLIELKQGDKQKERLQFSNFGSYTSKLSIKNQPYQLLYDDYDDNKDGEDEVELITNEDYNYLIFNILKARLYMNEKVYTVALTNSVGTDKCTIRIKVRGCPGKCQGPLKATKMTRNSCTLSWNVPKVDGGAVINHYEAMKRDQDKGYWSPACNNTKTLSAHVENLVEGKRYFFRVAAVNEYGKGRDLETTESIMAKLPFDVPKVPGTPKIVSSSSDTANLSWSPSTKVDLKKGDSVSETPFTTYSIEKISEDHGNHFGIQDEHKWMKAIISDLGAVCTPTECSCVVEGLIAGRKYCFRVVAENQAGRGGVSDTSQWLLLTDTIGPPVFKQSLEAVTEVLEGRDVEMKVLVLGSPLPSVAWYKDDQVLISGGKYDMVDDGESGVHRLVVKGVSKDDGDEYMVKASNTQGSKLCRSQLLVQRAPSLQVPSMYTSAVVQDRGSEVVIKLYYSGYPDPSLTWTKNAKVLKFIEEPTKEEKFNVDNYHDGNIISNYRSKRQSTSSKLLRMKSETGTLSHSAETPSFKERSVFEFTPRFVTLKIWNVHSSDNGDYEVELENKYGDDKACITIKINDVPARPTALTSTQLTDANYSLSWREPEEDGGSIVTSYYVEILHQQIGDQRWMPYVLSRFTKASVENLLLGKTYHFRVGACNVFGNGPPSDDITILARSPESRQL